MNEVRVFLVTVWNRLPGLGGFRAAVRPVGAEGSVVFSAADQVTRYLQQQADDVPDRASGGWPEGGQ
jgi:hypothetical protein